MHRSLSTFHRSSTNTTVNGVGHTMGDRKPKRTSSGNSDAHKSKVAKDLAARPVLRPATDIKPKGDPK